MERQRSIDRFDSVDLLFKETIAHGQRRSGNDVILDETGEWSSVLADQKMLIGDHCKGEHVETRWTEDRHSLSSAASARVNSFCGK